MSRIVKLGLCLICVVLMGQKCQPRIYWNNDTAQQVDDSGGADGDGDSDADGDRDADLDAANADQPRDAEAIDDGDDDDELPDADPDEEVLWPIVLYVFEGAGDPTFVPDDSGVAPLIPLALEDREPPGLAFEDVGLRFSGGRLQASQAHSELLGEALLAAGSFSVVVLCEAEDNSQEGPVRIVTYSSSASQRAFTLGQELGNFDTRIRTTATGTNGITGPFGSLSHSTAAFPTAGPRQLVLVYDGDFASTRVYVDGDFREEHFHRLETGEAATLDWETTEERFGLGDEFNADRQWHGVIYEVAIFGVALTVEQLEAWTAR